MIGDWLHAADKDERLSSVRQQEELIVQVTELIAVAMEQGGVSKSVLAKRLGKSPAFVTQLLAGNANMTLRTIADLFTALGLELHVGYRVLDGCAVANGKTAVPAPKKSKSATSAVSRTLVTKPIARKRVAPRK